MAGIVKLFWIFSCLAAQYIKNKKYPWQTIDQNLDDYGIKKYRYKSKPINEIYRILPMEAGITFLQLVCERKDERMFLMSTKN